MSEKSNKIGSTRIKSSMEYFKNFPLINFVASHLNRTMRPHLYSNVAVITHTEICHFEAL